MQVMKMTNLMTYVRVAATGIATCATRMPAISCATRMRDPYARDLIESLHEFPLAEVSLAVVKNALADQK